MADKRIIVNSPECDFKELCRHLREILSNINFETEECAECGWVAHIDDTWFRCADCGQRICESCVDAARPPVEKGSENKCDTLSVVCSRCGVEDTSEPGF